MIYFLDTVSGLAKLIPEVGHVKEKIIAEESVLTQWANKFYNHFVAYTPKVVAALLVLFFGLWFIRRVAILAEKA
ncbi:MAG: Mechanosensitive ion channel protein, partial [Bacteroidetes bacterium]|nr:Mechanosensitive ion channel protein [Bacteroidota bacterium]